jgi:carbon monoxide dehydrogenase subunit G
MEMTGSRQIAASREVVWAALNDAEVLRLAIPGCQELTGSPEEGFEAKVKQKVGPVSATFTGRVTLADVVAPESYTISGEGKGGAAGHAKGSAAVRLEDKDGGTLLTYDVKAAVGGKIAQLGSRLNDGAAKNMAD